MTTALGNVPGSPLNTAIVRDYASEHRRNSSAWQATLEIAPEVSASTASGQYLSVTQTGDLNLDTHPQQILPASLGATEYHLEPYTLGARTYACYRYMYRAVDLPDRKLAELAAQTGFDLEQHVSRINDVTAREIHRHLVYTAIGTSGNYASGHTSDPGSMASTSFNLMAFLETVGTALDDAGTWTPGDPIDVTVGFDVWPLVWSLDQVRQTLDSSGAAGYASLNYGDTAALASIFGRVLGPNVRIRRALGYYTTSATKTRYMSGQMSFTKPFTGNGEAGFVGTLIPAQENSGIINVREEYLTSMPGRRIYSDGYYGVHIDDNQAGYLATGLLS